MKGSNWRVGIAILAVAFLAMTTTPARSDIVDGLLNYWPLDDTLIDAAGDFVGSSSTVDDDGEFDGTNGTDGIDFNDGLFDQAIEQDGGAAQDNGFVRVRRSADTLRGGESISISAWVETAGFDTSWQTILSHGEGNQYRIARRGDGVVASYAGGVGDIPGSELGPDIGLDTGWHHILAISESGVSTRIWVDGMLIETGGAPTITDNGNDGAPGGSTPDLFIGANPQTGAQNREWWGKIDDVAIWDRPLEEDEILEIYETGLDGTPLGGLMEPGAGGSPGRLLGTGTGALLGDDLTDYNESGIEADYNPPDDLGGFTATFFSSDEPGFGGGEFAFNVFDNTLGGGNDKWCCGSVFPQIVGADFGDEVFTLTHFTVSSANDTPERDPRVWRIEGSNDGTNWTTIFSQDDPNASIWTERLQVIEFEQGTDYAEQTEAYSMFRMVTEATGLTDGAFFQLAEIEFFDANFVPPAPPAPTFDGLTDGLLNYWPMDDSLEDIAGDFPDSAGVVDDDGEFDGTNGVDGIDFNDGLFDGAIEQDGAAAQDNGFVRVARSEDTLQAGESISISAWVETAGFDTSWQTILSHGEGSQYRVARRSGASVASYAGGVGDIPGSDIGPDIGPDTGWHHIVAISEAEVSTRIWVDGELIETGGVPNITDNGNDGAPGGSEPDLFIGANPQTGANNREWWGKIDDVATWDRPLGEEEILEIYDAGLDGTALGDLMKVDTGPRFVRGDATSDGAVNISDPVFTLNGLFSGGPPSLCEKTADNNDDGDVNIADPVYLLNSLFSGGPSPLPPGPECGEDPTEDDLTCDSYPPCDG